MTRVKLVLADGLIAVALGAVKVGVFLTTYWVMYDLWSVDRTLAVGLAAVYALAPVGGGRR